MPNPIPEWDLARRLVKYLGMNQITGKFVTAREASVTMGIGRERLESLMKEKDIHYKIIPDEKSAGKDLLLLEYVPRNLALDAGISNQELLTSYRKFMDRQEQEKVRKVPRRSQMTKKKRENMKVGEFWAGKESSP